MSLDEEIRINQFGQSIYSVADFLDQFRQLDEEGKMSRYLELDFRVWQLKLTDSDIEQAIAQADLHDTNIIDVVLKNHRSVSGIGRTIYLPEGEFEQAYILLLYLFKTTYQRHCALEKENPASWTYWDLSNPEVVQGILTRHRELVEEVYAHPSFRSEFASLAKLQHEREAMFQEPIAETQTHVDFLKYDDLVTASINLFDGKIIRSMIALRNSLEKALAKRYGLDDNQVRRLVHEVIERHVLKI